MGSCSINCLWSVGHAMAYGCYVVLLYHTARDIGVLVIVD